jgi:hypothetical protein
MSTSSLFPSRPIRVLGLPGYAQNGEMLAGKLKAAQAIWGDEVELVTLDPVRLSSFPSAFRPS